MTYLSISPKIILPTTDEVLHVSRIALNSTRHTLRGSLTFCRLVTKVAASALAGCQAVVAILTLGYGSLCLENYKGIPKAEEARKKVHKAYQEIVAKEKHIASLPTTSEAQKKSSFENLFFSIGKLIASLLCIECIALYITKNLYHEFKNDQNILQTCEQARIAQKRTLLALLHEIDSVHMVRISLLQIGTGLTTLLTKGPVAQFFHYTGVIACNTGILLATAISGALGLTFIIRGTLNIYYANKNRELIHELRQKVQKIYQTNHLTAKQKAFEIKQLLHQYCCVQKDDKVEFLQTKANSLETIKDDLMLYRYVETLDQALHNKIVEFEIIQALGSGMLLGGMATLLVICLSGGSAALITSLVSSIALLFVEETRSIYKTSKWFHNYQKDLYQHPDWLLAPKGLEKIDHQPQTRSARWYLARIPTAIPRLIHYRNKQIDLSRLAQPQSL